MFELDLGDLAEKVGLRYSTSGWSQKRVLEVKRSIGACLRTFCIYESTLSTFSSALFGLEASLRSQRTYWHTQLTLYLYSYIWIFTVQLIVRPNRSAGISTGTAASHIQSLPPTCPLARYLLFCCFCALSFDIHWSHCLGADR